MKRRWASLIVAALLLAALIGQQRTRAADGGYTLVRGVADHNSVLTAQNGAYQLSASVGQPFARANLGNGIWLGGSYWYGKGGSIELPERIYIPLIKR